MISTPIITLRCHIFFVLKVIFSVYLNCTVKGFIVIFFIRAYVFPLNAEDNMKEFAI
jgi:hypothetical protein